MKNNFEIIVKYMLNLFSNLNNKFKSYISLLKNIINDNTKKKKIKIILLIIIQIITII